MLDRLDVVDRLEVMDILDVVYILEVQEWHKPHMTTAFLETYWMSEHAQHQYKCFHGQEGNTNGLQSHQC